MSEHSQQIEDVARVIRARIGGEASPAEDAVGTARLAARIGRASAPRRQFYLGAAVAFAAACLVAFGYASSTRLGYVVSAREGSTSAGATASSGSAVAFSDGSRIRLAAGAVGQVESTSFRGAVFRLEDGALEADVVHRQLTHWSVKAGPFTVDVKGTRFAVSWSPVARRFVLTLHEGAVDVRGDLLPEARRVQTGERLVVDLVAQRSWLEKGVAPTPQSETVVPGAPSAASEPSTVEGPAPVISPAAGAASAQHGQASKSALGPSWTERVAAGDFRGVVDDAQRRGPDGVLTQAASADLSALADAARYVGDRALSTRALNAQRQRFPGTERAAVAAFLLGKLAEESGNLAGAAESYARYLSERPSGTFAQEALGRRMLTLRGADPKAAAEAAREYLQRFPQGPRAGPARQIAGQP